jgi:hypothetical protein
MKIKLHLIFATTAMIANSCSDVDDENRSEQGVTSSQFFSDSANQVDAIDAALEETLAALSDSSSSQSSAALMLQSGAVTKSKICEQQDQSAKVSINRSIDRSFEKDKPKISIQKSISGSLELTRIWSHADQSVDCSDDSRPNISWDNDITNVSLEVTFERSKSIQMTKVLKQKDITKQQSKTLSSSGTRSITWTAHNEADGKITRDKIMSFSSNKSMSSQDQDEEKKEQAWSMKSETDNPLEITVVRSAEDKSLISKKIKTGAIISTSDSGVITKAVFENYLLSFENGLCRLVSGTISFTMYTSESDSEKRYTISVDSDGEYILTDITDADNETVVDDYDFDGCQADSFSI